MTERSSILITGCSDGSLGAALALAFHKRGWRVFATARNVRKMQKTAESGIETLQLDVTSQESITACVAAVKDLTGGSLDALVNNAGQAFPMPLMHMDMEKMNDIFNLNVFSIVTVTRSFLPLLFQSNRSGGALVVNNTSISSQIALPFQGTYCSSKAAASMLTQCLRLELAPLGVKVVELVTGNVKTSFYSNANVNTGGGVLPEDSPYNLAKEPIESFLRADKLSQEGADPTVWAEQVAGDLDCPSPSHQIWRGAMAFTSRIACHLPVGVIGMSASKLTGLDVLEKKVREQRWIEGKKHI